MNPINIITWNIEGARSCEFFRILKDIIKTYNPKVLAIFETQISGQKVSKLIFMVEPRVDAQGFKGGIWCF